MSVTDRLRRLYLSYLSKPPADRLVYRSIHSRQVRRMVEIGMGSCQRAVRMIQIAALSTPVSRVRYVGVDCFESRATGDRSGLTLKGAHRMLRKTGARVQLLPGDPVTVLSRFANTLAGTDLVVVSGQYDPGLSARAWFYVPRMLHPGSLVLVERKCLDGGVQMDRLDHGEIERLAAPATPRRAA